MQMKKNNTPSQLREEIRADFWAVRLNPLREFAKSIQVNIDRKICGNAEEKSILEMGRNSQIQQHKEDNNFEEKLWGIVWSKRIGNNIRCDLLKLPLRTNNYSE